MVNKRAQRVIDRMAEEREAFVAWVRTVPERQWTNIAEGGMWQARDYVAHLASIDPLLVAIVRGFQSGSERARDEAGRISSIDEWNEERILERRERSAMELLSELEANRPALDDAVADFTNEQLDRTFHFGGDKSRAPRDVKVVDFLNGLVYHDRWHMEDAKRALEGREEQPFGDAAWSSTMEQHERSD